MVDLTFLKKFTKGDDKKIKRYIKMYLQMTPNTFLQMQNYLEEQNWEQLAISAHSLKPQADYMGIADLKTTLVEIEESIKQGHFDRIKNLVAHAHQINNESEVILSKVMADLN